MENNTAKYEIRLTNVPDGAFTEDYLGCNRACETMTQARKIVADFNRAKKASPSNFEPGMRAEIVRA